METIDRPVLSFPKCLFFRTSCKRVASREPGSTTLFFQLLLSFCYFYRPLSGTWFTHNCNLKKKKETTDLPLFRSSRFDDRTRWHKLEGKFANIIVAITTLSLFYFSIFYFRVDQRGSSFNALPIFHFVSHPRRTPSGRRSFSRYFPFLLFLLDRRIFTIGWISCRLRFVRWIITTWCVFY